MIPSSMPQPTSETPQFVGTARRLEEVSVDLLFVPVFKGDSDQDLADLDRATAVERARAAASGDFTGKLYEMFVAPVTDRTWKTTRVAFIGAGPRDAADAVRVRRIAAACGYAARQRALESAGVVTRGLS